MNSNVTRGALIERRSFIQHWHEQAGACFSAGTNCQLVQHYGHPKEESDACSELALADLSMIPRWGLKGRGAEAQLNSRGLRVPPNHGFAQSQDDTNLLCRLTPEEFLWLGISEAGLQDPQTHESVNNAWFLPRADSHCWFLLSGRQTPHMFSRICGIDMRPERFENTQVALSSVARLNAIVIRADVGGQLRFHLLADSSSADYLWHCLLDTMSEFGGKPVGLSAYGMIR